jgi:hypothetical protein
MPYSISPQEVADEVRRDLVSLMDRPVPRAEVQIVRVPDQVLAFVRAGTTIINVNEAPFLRANYSGLGREYLYVVLTHEYMHIIGVADEREVRRMTLEVVGKKFGEDGPAFRIAKELADPRDVRLWESHKEFSPHTFMLVSAHSSFA